MKRITIVSIVTVAIVLTAVIFLRAETTGGRGWCGHGWHRSGPVSLLAHELKLDQDQQTKIRALWQAERPIVSQKVHELLAENKEMNAIAVQEKPDPGEVREIAAREATTIAALLVEKEQLQSKVYETVLNPEQRAKADELQKRLESRLDGAADRLRKQSTEK